MRKVAAAGPGKLTAAASRSHAVSRVSNGLLGIYGSAAGMVVVVLANGLGSTAQLIGQAGATLLFSTGCFLIASAAPHLARFGGRLGALSLASFAVAGLGGLVALAEMFTTYVLGSDLLQAWDRPATFAAAAFAVTGILLLRVAQRSDTNQNS